MTNKPNKSSVPAAQYPEIKLEGRIFLEMDIKILTGLRIGGSPAALTIGGMENPVIRDPLTMVPYIPGSSLRGKMRSLWEKKTGLPQNKSLKGIRIHTQESKNPADYDNDEVCRIFGVAGDSTPPNPTRLIVQDCFLSADSIEKLNEAQTDQPYTETKWETVIDRITSAANPRVMERVPAGAIFSDARLVYSVFSRPGHTGADDVKWFFDVIEMLQLVEDDYLGGSGSRGSGRVKFQRIRLTWRNSDTYAQLSNPVDQLGKPVEFSDVQSLVKERTKYIKILTDGLITAKKS